ncbi:unnamed protein product, partial [Larinioides sclopetarius]
VTVNTPFSFGGRWRDTDVITRGFPLNALFLRERDILLSDICVWVCVSLLCDVSSVFYL